MNIVKIIFSIIIALVAIVCFVISCFQFREKGYLFNNAYLYASEQERRTMNKKPHYKQSAIVFLLLGFALLILGATIFFEADWLLCLFFAIIIALIVYVIVSEIKIKKNNT